MTEKEKMLRGKLYDASDEKLLMLGPVVTRKIPAGVVAVGNPCKVIKEI